MHVTGRRTHPISPSRQAAFDVLEGVDEGGYASDLLRAITERLESRDAGLAGQIVLGSLRYQLQLDYLIRLYAGRPADSLHRAVKIVLRTAIFQLRYLDRIPPHAAVDEAVELVKRQRRAASGLVNAVLRKVNRNPVTWPDRETEFSCPSWLLERWDDHFGRERSNAIANAALQEPDDYVRIPLNPMPPNQALPPGLELEKTEVPGAYRLISGARPPGLRLHDISSQAIVPLLDIQPGDRYLDLCAAPGNKTRQALEYSPGLAVACDISFSRMSSVGPLCPRVILDGTRPLPFPPQSFDRIFIDAPCSGTGTIRRNPEIKWRVTTEDLGRFGFRQKQMLTQACKLLAPGGSLLYATCSLEKEENESVVAGSLAQDRRFTSHRTFWRLPGKDLGDGFYGTVLRFRST